MGSKSGFELGQRIGLLDFLRKCVWKYTVKSLIYAVFVFFVLQVSLAFFFLYSHHLHGRNSISWRPLWSGLPCPVRKFSVKNSNYRMFLRWSFSQIIECSTCYVRQVKTAVRHLFDSFSSVDPKVTYTTGTTVYLRVAKSFCFQELDIQSRPRAGA